MKKILFIVGSLRKGSFNLQVAHEVESMLKGRADVSYLSYGDIPLLNQDIEYPAPEAVVRLRETIAAADAIWVFTPEYNRSYPGHLKNIFDWLSRPVKLNDFETPTVIKGKKIALSGAGGNFKTAKGRDKLVELLQSIGADVMTDHQTGIALGTEAWTEGRFVLTDENRHDLAAEAEALLELI
jgi:chromate reductase